MFKLFEWIYGVNSIAPVDIYMAKKCYYKVVFRHGKPYISCQSLLLSTIILNDNGKLYYISEVMKVKELMKVCRYFFVQLTSILPQLCVCL